VLHRYHGKPNEDCGDAVAAREQKENPQALSFYFSTCEVFDLRMDGSRMACPFELCNRSAGQQERKLHPSYKGRRNNEWLATQRRRADVLHALRT
jgi:hypothetical protein